MTTVIALAGPAGAGKDLTAEIMMSQMIRRNPNVSMRTLSFATPIKQAVACILGCRVEDFEDRAFKEGSLKDSHNLDSSPRKMMQLLGDDYARQMIDDQIWIKTAQNTFNSYESQKVDYVFITDLRYENEHKWVLENGGVVIYIDRPNAAPVSAHVSEAGLSRPPCYCIDNTTTIDDLRVRIRDMVGLLQPVPAYRLSIDDCSPAEWDRVGRM